MTQDEWLTCSDSLAMLAFLEGNPFRTAPFDSEYRPPLAFGLTRAAYDNRTLPEGTLDPARLAALADDLEAAGCTDSEVLGHLRLPGLHWRGCWPLDLLLDKK